MEYDSFVEVEEIIKDFSRATGSVFVVGASKKLKENFPRYDQCKYRRLKFDCVHGKSRRNNIWFVTSV